MVWNLPGGVAANAVNSNTLIVGKVKTASGAEEPGVWQEGQFAGALMKPVNATRISTPVATDDGVVAGSYRVSGANRDIPATWTCTG